MSTSIYLLGSAGSGTLGTEGIGALSEIAQIKRLRQTWLGWNFMAALVEGDGLDPEPLLLDVMSLAKVDLVGEAFALLDAVLA